LPDDNGILLEHISALLYLSLRIGKLKIQKTTIDLANTLSCCLSAFNCSRNVAGGQRPQAKAAMEEKNGKRKKAALLLLLSGRKKKNMARHTKTAAESESGREKSWCNVSSAFTK
jgi:hypothetical protein